MNTNEVPMKYLGQYIKQPYSRGELSMGEDIMFFVIPSIVSNYDLYQ